MSKESRRAARNARAATHQSSTSPSGTARAGRRERVRRIDPRPSFVQRYRTAIIGVAVVAIVAVVGFFAFAQSTQASYTCSIQFDPSPTPSPEAGSTTRLGFAQDSMGASHDVSRPQKYTFCPPASGNHYNGAGIGPIAPRLYRPGDAVGPPNWIHNLEHGGLVVLYRNDSDGATDAGQSAFQSFFDTFPPSPICELPAGRLSPVIARFDSMKWPYAALVWGRVLPLEEWDPALVLQFYATESERLDADGAFVAPPEPQCAAPSQSPAPGSSASPAASGAASPAASEAASPSAAPASTEPSAPPSPAAS
ncbi:MAG TPA: DUF3105 domain-containing protein [Candidatus Limnocylindrales bacterium]|nr:DUF3105 domain-containing protein [Candidatus Limnocylindrales bacterium]